MMKWICFIVLINQTLTQILNCNTVGKHDTKPLARAREWTTTTDHPCLENQAAHCTYFFSFCQAAPTCHYDYSACQKATEASNMIILGNQTTTTQFFEDENGLYAKFLSGPMQDISNTSQCVPSLRINFKCNPDSIWMSPVGPNATLSAPQPADVSVDPKDKCSTIMTFEYAGACVDDEVKPTDGISPGAIFLIVLFSSALVYFLCGIMYNRLVNHRSGISLLPHAQFWIGLPLYIIEGCRASITCCSRTPQPSRATYDSV